MSEMVGAMLKIAYCDDQEKDQENLFHVLTQIEEVQQVKFDLRSFSHGENLCASVRENHYDILLLEIYFSR